MSQENSQIPPTALNPSELSSDLVGYDRTQTYCWNYQHAPDPPSVKVPKATGSWTYCGIPIESPLAIAAGPLLSGRWILYYAELGFEVLTYKTVRTREHTCYPPPNLLPVDCPPMTGNEPEVTGCDTDTGSWAISYGMPSKSPDVWRADVESTRNKLADQKLLSVSVVASPQPGWTIEQIADDFAICARWAIESGADCVELNCSCPNVTTPDSQLFHQPADAGAVARHVRAQIGSDTPLLIKIGYISNPQTAHDLASELNGSATALVMTNGIATRISSPQGEPFFDGQARGIGGQVIRETSLKQVGLFDDHIRTAGLDLCLIGVGGISKAEHVHSYVERGAESVQLATAAMLDPLVGVRIRAGLSDYFS